MRTFLIVLGTIVLAVALLAAGLLGGLVLTRAAWGPRLAATWGGMMSWRGTGMMPWRSTAGADGAWGNMPCTATGGAACGQGFTRSPMMGGRGWGTMPCGAAGGATCTGPNASPGITGTLTLEEAQAAAEQYVGRLGYGNLEIKEVMEFAYNYYAIAAETDTGTGAMELLVDKNTGAVGPEPGPNMMWNAKYGMMGRGGMGMMGRWATGEMTLSPEEAGAAAQRWLDANMPGRTTGEADPFYGYYTFHFLKDGEVEGMLSVHGSSGDVWYHHWHGDFVAMIGEEEA